MWRTPLAAILSKIVSKGDFARGPKVPGGVMLFGMTTLSEIRSLDLSDEEIRRHFPPMILGIARATDFETALMFADRYSGQQFYLSSSPEIWPFSEIVGLEKTGRIIEYLGGDRFLDVPAAFGNRIVTRLKGIRMLRDGATLNAVCAELGVSRSTVKQWRADFVRAAR